MAVLLNVTGPHQIYYGAGGVTPSNLLGRTDNDDLFSVEMEYKYLDIYTNEFGQNPAEAIQVGAMAYCNFTLVSYDPTVVSSMIAVCSGQTSAGTGPQFPIVGQGMRDSSNWVSLKVDSDGTGPNYTLNYCRLISHNIKDIGNKPTRVGFRFEVIRNSATSAENIYTVS